MSGDLRQVPLGALTVNVQLLSTSQIPAERQLKKHVVFHVHKNYVKQQAQYFRFRTGLAD